MKDSEINNIAIPETYLDKDEYVRQIINIIQQADCDLEAAFKAALKHDILSKSIKWNTRRALTDRWYLYDSLVFIGKTKNLNLVKDFEDKLFSDVRESLRVNCIALKPIDEKYIHRYLEKLAVYCLNQIDKDVLRKSYHMHGRYSDIERCHAFAIEFERTGHELQSIGINRLLKPALEANTKPYYYYI